MLSQQTWGEITITRCKEVLHKGLTPAPSQLPQISANRRDDWLFHELQNERDPGDTFGKRFARFREYLGVDDKREGKRRSLVNFHSFRRWFVTEAERASQPVSTIAAVVGHSEGREGMTFGVYSAGPSEDQRRTCVAAVKLPVAAA